MAAILSLPFQMSESQIGSASRDSSFHTLQCMAPIPPLDADTNVFSRDDRRRTPVLERSQPVFDEGLLSGVFMSSLCAALRSWIMDDW